MSERSTGRLHDLLELRQNEPGRRTVLRRVRQNARAALRGRDLEPPWIIVSEHDDRGVVRRFDQYDLGQLDAALARFAELRA